MIYYATTPYGSTVKMYFKDKNNLHLFLKSFTDSNLEAEKAVKWCKSASIGDVYKAELFEIEVIEDNIICKNKNN